jgi:hypothetical protein
MERAVLKLLNIEMDLQHPTLELEETIVKPITVKPR